LEPTTEIGPMFMIMLVSGNSLKFAICFFFQWFESNKTTYYPTNF